ncbi:hypothetical protein AM593_10395, partial [Mytilus galloprovincialis]
MNSQRHIRLKKRELIPCFHETQPSGCTRPGCPFKHSKPDSATRSKYEDTLSATHAMAPVENGSDFWEPSPSPSDLICLICYSNSIMLSWSEPDEINGYINGYKIVYRERIMGSSRWKSVKTKSKQTVYTVNYLKGDTQYEFKICTVDRDGEDGSFSHPAVEFKTKPSLAHHVKASAKRLGHSDPECYKIPFQKTKGGTNNAAKTQKYHFGKEIPGITGKTIMLLGATGSGKSKLLDGMINYIFGVSWDDNFRLKMVELSDAEKTRYTDQISAKLGGKHSHGVVSLFSIYEFDCPYGIFRPSFVLSYENKLRKHSFNEDCLPYECVTNSFAVIQIICFFISDSVTN